MVSWRLENFLIIAEIFKPTNSTQLNERRTQIFSDNQQIVFFDDVELILLRIIKPLHNPCLLTKTELNIARTC